MLLSSAWRQRSLLLPHCTCTLELPSPAARFARARLFSSCTFVPAAGNGVNRCLHLSSQLQPFLPGSQRCAGLLEGVQSVPESFMARRIGIWCLAGFFVGCAWTLFFFASGPGFEIPRSLWLAVDLTAPASLLRAFPLKFYWFILLNAAAYGLVGSAIEFASSRWANHPTR